MSAAKNRILWQYSICETTIASIVQDMHIVPNMCNYQYFRKIFHQLERDISQLVHHFLQILLDSTSCSWSSPTTLTLKSCAHALYLELLARPDALKLPKAIGPAWTTKHQRSERRNLSCKIHPANASEVMKK